ncbi:MAG: class A beta-lactamase-related serine hydrolase, partial [Candidatus Eremiobacteraeota bacterium]|nr:class A beta-lactamase-related serine hydrolase [Candidatus Eremiobacteraeota bacterium]
MQNADWLYMRYLVSLAIAAVLFVAPAMASAALMPGPLADLQMSLSAMSLHAPGHVAMEIRDLSTGFSEGVNSTASMPAASTIKIPVMVEVFHQLSQGHFDFNTRVTLQRSDKDWGSGWLSDRSVGSSYPVSQLLSAMITVSDNTATNMLIRLVGRQQINATMLDMGLQHTKLSDYIRSEGNAIRWALRSSPSDMVELLTQMANSRLVDEWSSREMISILSGQRHNGLIPEPLPSDVQIAHKTGTLHDTLNDVGIVYAGSGPYVIAVMTTNLPSLGAGRTFIRGVSRIAYDDILRLGDWHENGGTALPEP